MFDEVQALKLENTVTTHTTFCLFVSSWYSYWEYFRYKGSVATAIVK